MNISFIPELKLGVLKKSTCDSGRGSNPPVPYKVYFCTPSLKRYKLKDVKASLYFTRLQGFIKDFKLLFVVCRTKEL